MLAQIFGHADIRSVERYAKLETEVVRSVLGSIVSRAPKRRR